MKKTIFSIFIYFLFISFLHSQDNKNFFVFLNSNSERKALSESEVESLQTKHLRNIDSLYNMGKLAAAGPFEGGGGIFILVAPTIDSAFRILETDPAILAKRFTIEVYEFNFRIGSLCAPIQPFEMSTYFFVRYQNPTDSIDKDLFDESYLEHLNIAHTFKDSILIDGSFEGKNGLIQIFKFKNVNYINKLIELDPFITNMEYNAEIRKLWIAKGTFCNM